MQLLPPWRAGYRGPREPGRVQVVTDRRYRFAVAPEELWAAVTRLDQFQHWWPWLRRFDGTDLGPGEHWSCAVQPPLSYPVRFRLLVDHVDAPRGASATVSGDIVGTAALTIEPCVDGSEARLVSHLSPANRFLLLAANLAQPAVRLAHDWVLDSAVRQFRSRGLPPP